MSPPFASAVALVGFLALEVVLRRGPAGRAVQPRASDRGTTTTLLLAYALAILALGVGGMLGPQWPANWQWGGVVLSVLGLLLRSWAMRTLGEFFTRTLLLAEDQRLIQSGPYARVRHPGYLGSLLLWSGAAAASGSVLATVFVVGLLLLAYRTRIAAEERMLEAEFHSQYSTYKQRSWRLLPFIY